MALQLSRREVDDLRSSLDRAIYRTIGKSDSSLLSTVSSCLSNGYERRKIIDKISSHIDSKKASKLADKIIALAQELVSSSKSSSQKRKHESSSRDKDKDVKKSRSDRDRHETKYDDEKDSKSDSKPKEPKSDEQNGAKVERKSGFSSNGVDVPPALAEGESIGSKIAGLSADRIKLMMANAQKEIEERKKALMTMKGEDKSEAVSLAVATAQIKAQGSVPGLTKPGLFSKPDATSSASREELEKQRKIAELQARIQRKLAGGALQSAGATGPAPLILDREGRTIDTSGKQVQLTHVVPTLKANIRAKRREEFKAQLSSASTSEAASEGRWVDARVQCKPPARTKRALRFHEPGKFRQMAERLRMKVSDLNVSGRGASEGRGGDARVQCKPPARTKRFHEPGKFRQMAERLRMKAQLEKLQSEISQIARKTGISSATKLALLAADTPDAEEIPDIECIVSISSATKLALLAADTPDAEEIPDIEWWDSVILLTPEEREAKRNANKSADQTDDRSDDQRVDACNTGDDDILDNLNEEAITDLVEHPQQLRPASE
ncbi:unnamed protein product [Plutella xylostella]|uniref:(diamondback moth) hypothetical protein n=1 Tax=Plutella xylostella TaxID=51655 RepID=A0A8S4FWB5_PLUXY|nr:unnamed protein product [Plutella xylostella]